MKYTEEVNKAIEAMKNKLDNDENSWFYYDETETIFDLLEKQNKEIERLEKYNKDYIQMKDIKLYACDINKNKECKKTNCYINGGECNATTDKTKVKYINLNDYVSKDKIRRKIKELENQKVSIKVGFEKIFEAKMDNAKIIDTLRELLRGE